MVIHQESIKWNKLHKSSRAVGSPVRGRWHDGRVSERAASTTAVLVCQGRAVADGRYAATRFADPVAIELLDPAEREVVDRVRGGAVPNGRERLAYEMARQVAPTMVSRTVAIDDAIRAHPGHQVVILGAGLDARAWRMPELERAVVFEVDHPASQADKRRRAAGLAAPVGRHVWVAADLAREPLAPAMEAAGFDRSVVTTWVWEGVVPYLRAEDVRATVAQLGALSAPGSRLVVNYQAKALPVVVMRHVMRVVWRVARQPDPLATEPWRSLWRASDLRAVLQDNGFDVVSDSDLLELSVGLGLPAWGTASLVNGRVAVATRR